MINNIAVGIVKKYGNSGSIIHNETTEIQGGNSTERYHFEQSQHAELLDLIYKNNISTIAISPTSGERGVATALSAIYNIATRSDVFTAAEIDNGIGDVLPNINTGNKTVSIGNSVANKTVTMDLDFTRKGVATTETKTATYNSYVPQFAGVSVETDFATYAGLVAALQKFVQSSAAILKESSPVAQHIWFISTKNNATILDQNNFQQTVGTWGDGVSEFYRKSLVLTLADGTTTATVYLYRSRNVKTLSNFTYKIQ